MLKVTQHGRNTSGPTWDGDFPDRHTMLANGVTLDSAQFPREGAVTVTANGVSAQGAVAVTVDALSGPIPSGAVLYFGAGEFALLTADAAAGATSLTVEALPNAIEDGDTATYDPGTGDRVVKSGTVIGKTDAETYFGPAATDGSDDEVYLVQFEHNIDVDGDFVECKKMGLVYHDYLPEYPLASALLDQLRSRGFTITKGRHN